MDTLNAGERALLIEDICRQEMGWRVAAEERERALQERVRVLETALVEMRDAKIEEGWTPGPLFVAGYNAATTAFQGMAKAALRWHRGGGVG